MRRTPIHKPKAPIQLEVIYFKNLTSDTEIISSSVARERQTKLAIRTKGKSLRKIDGYDEMTLVEMQEDTVLLEIPSGKCQKGHHALFELTTKGAEEELRFKSTSQVIDLEDLGEGRAQVTLTMKQYDSDNWEKIRALLVEHQSFIQGLFDNLKN